MKTLRSIFLLFLVVKIHAQNKSLFFIEGGTAINAPFSQNFHVEDDHTSTTWYEWKGSVKSLPGYYLRGGIEKQYALCHRSQVSFPVSISYLNTVQNVEMDGGWMGCVGGFMGHQSVMRTDHSGIIMAGIKQIINVSDKISVQNSLNFSNTLLICSEDKVKQTGESGTYAYYGAQWLRSIHASFSAQTGLFYQLNENSKIGLNAEYFFVSKTVMPKRNDAYGAMGFGINTKTTLLTAGIRLQHSF
jgi:hypothetical protein